MRKDDLVVCGECGKLVAVRSEGKPRKFANFLCGALREFGMRIQPRADRGSADGEVIQSIQNLLQALDVALQQAGPAAEFLAKGQRNGVLQMRAADLHYILEFFRFGGDRVVNALNCRDQRVLHTFCCRNVHRRWESVVG